jgi:apolipoprotein N-acyltransferase
MPHTLETAPHKGQAVPKRMPWAPFIAVIVAANAAFIFGLLEMLSWQKCVDVVLVVTVLAGGAVFTILEMQRLGKQSQ